MALTVESYALYSEQDVLPPSEMNALVPGLAPEVSTTTRGVTYLYRWPDLTIQCSEMPADRLREHLKGFEAHVRRISLTRGDSRGERLIQRLRRTKMVVGVELQPGRDVQGRAEEFIGRLCGGLHPLVFFDNAVYDWRARLVLGPDGSFDVASEIDGCLRLASSG